MKEILTDKEFQEFISQGKYEEKREQEESKIFKGRGVDILPEKYII